MLIKNDFEAAESIDAVWAFFGDIPQVAACLPGADLNEQIGDDHYQGTVAISIGPVKLEFDGTAEIKERNEADRTLVVDAEGADKKGRGQASLQLNAGLSPTPRGTKVDVALDLQLSGAAAQYGRGMVADVTAVLLTDFATNMQNRLDAIQKGLDPGQVAQVKPASGFAIGLRALRMALARVFRRFFLPYRPPNS
ncbi:MAG: SRPBCC family protein [Actinobacteria bacterium]|nr:SRPBCC family protein [Actinomycetota bacterium]NIS30850.1 SRPBCC family protein [Actinomycetota bacterium]NIT96842.1 SRPBCC family protein [Actinomycetota bacterium]NIU20510.1 SRPBCC family protein [Actinomycetota bacterium]NIU66035.1 SRPBCC family protein [Actinomycetota bacterium]